MTEWTQKRIQEFWEKHGFTQKKDEHGITYWCLRYGNNVSTLPRIADFNALFRWAVPKNSYITFAPSFIPYGNSVSCLLYHCEDNGKVSEGYGTAHRECYALALAEAIEKLKEMKDEMSEMWKRLNLDEAV